MRRRLKPQKKENYFHVTVRTAQGAHHLADRLIKDTWEAKLFQLTKAYYVDVLAFSILSNHVHLVLKVNCPEKDPKDLQRRFEYLESTLVSRRKWHEHYDDWIYERFTDLSCFMRDLNQWIAAWHNKHLYPEDKIARGHLWSDRFFSKVVGDDQYLLTVMSYVDLNPVRAGLTDSAGKFRNSSAGWLKEQIEMGITPDVPQVGWLRHIDPGKRAEAYLHWLDFLASCEDKSAVRKSLREFYWAIEKEDINIPKVRLQIKNKEPSNWSKPVFANPAFAKAILEDEGWLKATDDRHMGRHFENGERSPNWHSMK